MAIKKSELYNEMAHLLVRHHDDRSKSLLDRYLPNWRLIREALNAAPLAHANWLY